MKQKVDLGTFFGHFWDMWGTGPKIDHFHIFWTFDAKVENHRLERGLRLTGPGVSKERLGMSGGAPRGVQRAFGVSMGRPGVSSSLWRCLGNVAGHRKWTASFDG